ncbi:MAG TPA: hypothetical protein VFV95_12735 [Vicinamibacterales bacterium]|nr:hypothetical protein [Vicinamibacterales bacterium]
MPFLRVLRDKRGYETTYLMHWFREGTRQRSRVLYVFRTPANARVGRLPLDRDVLRQLELRYPDISFDWESVRENQQVIEPAPDMRRRRPKRDEQERVPAPSVEAPPAEPRPAAPAVPQIPAAVEGATPDEQIAFLLHWYPVVRDRIAGRMTDPARREALTALAERLNPAAWTDADHITAGLQQAAEALERLSRVLTRRRRRNRRRSPPAQGTSSAAPDADAPSTEPPSSDS